HVQKETTRLVAATRRRAPLSPPTRLAVNERTSAWLASISDFTVYDPTHRRRFPL
ncbi:jg19020, partial [Pararge aegeria aegeria]